MSDEPEVPGGWLPPKAPDGRPPPRFEAPGGRPPAPAPPRDASPDRPPAPPHDDPSRGPLGPPPPYGRPAPRDARPTFVRPGDRPGAAPGGATEPLAITSLLAGIAALVILLLSLGLGFMFSLPCSIVAWLAGRAAKKRVADGRAQSGEGLAHAGVILGIAGIALAVIAMVVWTVLVLQGFSLDEFQDDLRRELERRRST